MHHENIETLQEEALAIIALEQEVLEQMLKENILSSPSKSSPQTFDTESAPNTIEMLKGEAYKLRELEMVLAVVGTMKAGKSTTINAIVGTEILPNRNAPMTAIPTIIRHTKGQTEPRLMFSDTASQPINQLVQDLEKAFKKAEFNTVIEKLRSDQDLYELVQQIQRGEKIINLAFGEQQIFKFLKSINDLVRISPIFGLQFPFSSYKQIDQFPVIDVEFTHLKETVNKPGRLILLDTPGPNEAGQQHLRAMLQDQLKKASAVLAVMDYTQLKSEADAQIRDDLTSIAVTAKDRIYALVNKFDQKDRNGMEKEEVKDFVQGLTNNLIKREKVYPVSSKLGYLANRARHQRLADGSLPDIGNAPWVEDFYEEAGLRREGNRTPERIAEAIEDLWEDSKFSQPLEGIIKVAYGNAAIIALESATDKLTQVGIDLNNQLGLREQALSTSSEELQNLVSGLKSDIEQIDSTEILAEKTIKQHKDSFSRDLNQLINQEFKKVREAIDQAIFSGNDIAFNLKKQDEAQKDLAKEQKRPSFLPNFNFSALLKGLKAPREIKYDPENPLINFGDHETDAQDFLIDISNIVTSLNENTNQQIEAELEKMLEVFEINFQEKIITESNQTIKQLSARLQKSGFKELSFSVPSHKNLALKLSASSLMHEALFEDTRDETRFRVGDSFWARMKNKVNDDWGLENYSVKVKDYKVDMQKIKQGIEKSFSENQVALNQSINKNIEQPLQDASDKFFKVFKTMVEKLRGDFIQSLKDHEKSHQERELLLKQIQKIKQIMPQLVERAEELKKYLAGYNS